MAKKSAKKAARKSARPARAVGARKAAKKAAKGTRATKTARTGGAKKSKGARKTKRTANAAFMAPVTPSATLAAVVGNKPIPRTEVTKRLWAYIKKNKLQDARNKRQINADATLKAVFGGKSKVDMFEMTRLVGKQLK